jgi:alpha-L-arabinofuranosidase
LVKVVNCTPVAQKMEVELRGVKELEKEGELEVIAGAAGDVNLVGEKEAVSPTIRKIAVSGVKFGQEFPGNSVSVLRLKAK